MIEIKTVNKKFANEFIARWHRHNDPVPQMQITFCLGIFADAPGYRCVGVVIVGEPCGRFRSNKILEVRRVCFVPDFQPKRLKRYYHEVDNKPDDSPTMRLLPVVFYNGNGNPIRYDVTTSYKLPSFVLKSVEHYVPLVYTNIEKLCTYIQDKENGTYIEQAGYLHDKTFTRRGIKKRRFMKEVA